ncbi:hypothetical protein [Clostridium sp. UBA7339]|uniref:Uncharacterized protein n=1 Tax=Clostridium sulfidigenes TaxID=318464 RepID=A0A927ZLL6_9CLOT|nr:hypothetical protein [Clostridium sulfidigenes]
MSKNNIINIIIFIISIYLNYKWVFPILRTVTSFGNNLDKYERKKELKKGVKYLVITVIYVAIVIYYLNNRR